MSKEKSLLQERLVGLYLRLNGYFQTGYIPHSAGRGQIGTDVDRLAIRFPKHKQPERVVGDCPMLQIPPNSIDIILAEVKNKTLEFNASIKSNGKQSQENWEQILRWSGLFENSEIQYLFPRLMTIADNDGEIINGNFEFISLLTNFGNITIRPIIFSIETDRNTVSSKIWINGGDMIRYIWDCLCPDSIRNNCATRYPFEAWGFEFTEIVEFFKSRHKSDISIPHVYFGANLPTSSKHVKVHLLVLLCRKLTGQHGEQDQKHATNPTHLTTAGAGHRDSRDCAPQRHQPADCAGLPAPLGGHGIILGATRRAG